MKVYAVNLILAPTFSRTLFKFRLIGPEVDDYYVIRVTVAKAKTVCVGPKV